LENGDLAGIVSMGVVYGALAVSKEHDKFVLKMITGEQKFNNDVASTIQESNTITELNVSHLYFKYTVKSTGVRPANETETAPCEEISFAYSLDGKEYETVASFEAFAGRWVGVKNGMFSSHIDDGDGGFVIAEYVRYFK
ncbi:MAG: hypothetical protein ACK5H4_10230, partial [Lacrimispora sphenoides]